MKNMKLGKIIKNKDEKLVVVCPECKEEIQISSVIPTKDGRHYYLDCSKCKNEVEIDINVLRYFPKEEEK